MNKLLSYLKSNILSVLTLILVLVLLFGNSPSKLGGTTNYDALDVSDGYYVDGSVVISGSGVLTGSINSANSNTLSGATTLSGTNTLSGATRIYSPVITGAIAVLSGSTTTVITASQACAGTMVYASSSITEASTLNLPAAEAMFAASNCLSTNGDAVTMWVRNMTASTTVITAGSASTTIAIDNGGTVTLGALGTAKITFKRLTSSLMYAFVSVFKP